MTRAGSPTNRPTGMAVRDIMSRDFVGVSESDGVDDVVGLLVEEDTPVAAVVRGGDPVGIVTERDLLSLVPGASDGVAVEDVMRDPEPEVSPDLPFADALDRMSSRGTRRLLVTAADGELVGVVTAADALTAAASLVDNGAALENEQAATADAAGQEPMTGSGDADGSYSAQSVCENCGTLTHDLRNFNGQLICADCRDV